MQGSNARNNTHNDPSSILGTHPPRLPRFSTRHQKKGSFFGDFDSMWCKSSISWYNDVTMMLQWWYNDNPGVECGKEGSQLCLYSLAGAKWEIIAAGGTLHRLESIHTANTDRKGLWPVKCSIWSDQNSEYSLFQGRQEKYIAIGLNKQKLKQNFNSTNTVEDKERHCIIYPLLKLYNIYRSTL